MSYDIFLYNAYLKNPHGFKRIAAQSRIDLENQCTQIAEKFFAEKKSALIERRQALDLQKNKCQAISFSQKAKLHIQKKNIQATFLGGLKQWRVLTIVITSLFFIALSTNLVFAGFSNFDFTSTLAALSSAALYTVFLMVRYYKRKNLDKYQSDELAKNKQTREAFKAQMKERLKVIEQLELKLSQAEKDLKAQIQQIKGDILTSFDERVQEINHLESNVQNLKKKVAARVIKQFWKKNKGGPDFNGAIGFWLRGYCKDFVAHAIWTQESVNCIMRDGRVKPSEMTFRETGEVEYELGSLGLRTRVFFPSEFLEKLKKLPEPRNCGLNFRLSAIGNHDCLENYPFTYESSSWNLPDERSQAANCARTNPVILGFSPLTHTPCREMFNSIPAEHRKGLSEYHFYIMRDQCREKRDRVDTILAAHYRNIKKLQMLLSNKSPFIHEENDCYQLRQSVLGASSLQCEIRAGRNCIFWSYGSVIVMRGNATPLISRDAYGEAILLPPYKNGGEFLCLELARPDTIILGPSNILEPFMKKYPDYHFVTIESLSPRQKNMLKVPFRLDPIGNQAKTLSYTAL